MIFFSDLITGCDSYLIQKVNMFWYFVCFSFFCYSFHFIWTVATKKKYTQSVTAPHYYRMFLFSVYHVIFCSFIAYFLFRFIISFSLCIHSAAWWMFSLPTSLISFQVRLLPFILRSFENRNEKEDAHLTRKVFKQIISCIGRMKTAWNNPQKNSLNTPKL